MTPGEILQQLIIIAETYDRKAANDPSQAYLLNKEQTKIQLDKLKVIDRYILTLKDELLAKDRRIEQLTKEIEDIDMYLKDLGILGSRQIGHEHRDEDCVHARRK